MRAQDAQGRAVELRAAMTVGADGIRSSVAADTGARVRRRGRSAGAVLYRYVEGLDSDGYEWAYGDGAAAGLIPTNDGLTCVFVGTSPDRMRELRRIGAENAFAVSSRPVVRRAARTGCRSATRGTSVRLGGCPRLSPALLGAGVGAGRRRRLLQGPDHLARHHRRPPRRGAAQRRAARVTGRRSPGARGVRGATRRPGTVCRAGCSPRRRPSRRSTGTPTAPAGWSAR